MVNIPAMVDYTIYIKQLKKANIPQDERLKIISALGKLAIAGASEDTLDKINQKIITSPEFKEAFLENPEDAINNIE